MKVLALALAVASSAHAAMVNVVTDPSAFVASLEPGSATQDFNLFNGFYSSVTDVSIAPFTIGATASGGLYADASAGFSTNSPGHLVFAFSGATLPTAVAFNAFLTDPDFNFLPGEISVAVNGASVATYNYTTFAQSFRGITSDVPITSIGFSGPGSTGAFATIDNLVVGTALSVIPEPSSVLATGILLASALLLRRRDSEALALAQGSAAPGSLNS